MALLGQGELRWRKVLSRNQRVQPRRGRRHGGRPAYAGKWSNEDDVADHLDDLPPWQALQVCSSAVAASCLPRSMPA